MRLLESVATVYEIGEYVFSGEGWALINRMQKLLGLRHLGIVSDLHDFILVVGVCVGNPVQTFLNVSSCNFAGLT